MRASVVLLLPIFGVVACAGEGKDSNGSGDDSGTQVTETNFEPGCITVDDGGGYKFIQDAITVAKEGSVIALCNGTYEEAVTVDKGVQIVGESREGVIISVPAAAAAFTITATGASLSTFTIQTSKDGIVFEGATNSSASDFTILAPPNYGVAFNNAVDSSVSDCTIDTPGYTGVKISGGSPTLARCSVPHATSYAVTINDSAEATLDSNTFDGIVATTDEDGYAVHVDGATAHFMNNQFLGADSGAISADSATLTADGDAISNGAIGILASASSLNATGLTLTENAIVGILVSGTGDVSIADSTISVADGSTCENPYASFWSSRNSSVACGGLVAQGATVNLSNVSVSNYNTYGIFAVTAPDVDAAFTFDGLQISNVGRMGVIVQVGASGTVNWTNSTIDGTREPELVEPCGDQPSQTGSYQLNYSPAVYGSEGTWTVDGLQITNSAGWGLALAGTKSTITNSTVDSYACAGIINLSGTLTASGNTFSHGAQLGAVWDYQGSSLITGNTFTENHAESRYTYEDGSYYVSNGVGQDIQGGQSAEMIITDNIFTDGDQGIQLSEVASSEVSNNTWTDYDGTAVVIYSGGPLLMENNTIDDSYGQALSISGGASPQEVEIKGLDIRNTRPSHEVYGQYDADGSVIYSGDYYSDASYAIYSYGGAMDIQDMTIESAGFYYSLFVYNSSLAADGIDLDDASYLMYGYWYDGPPDVLLQNVTVGNNDSVTVYVDNNTGSTGSVYLSNVTVGTSYQLLQVIGRVDVTVDGLTAESTGSTAFSFGSINTDTDSDGVYELLVPTGVQLSNVTVNQVGGAGISAEVEQMVLSNVEFGTATNGVYVTTSTGGTSGGYPYNLSNVPALVDATDVRIGTTTGDAFSSNAVENVLDGVTVEDAGAVGLNLTGTSSVSYSEVQKATDGIVATGSLTVLNSTIGAVLGNGVEFTGDTLDVEGVSVGVAANHGVQGQGTTLSVIDTVISSATNDGIYLDGTTILVQGSTANSGSANGLSVYTGTVDISGNSFSSNAGYGMLCSGITTNSCSSNVLENNVMGAQSGCAETCGN